MTKLLIKFEIEKIYVNSKFTFINILICFFILLKNIFKKNVLKEYYNLFNFEKREDLFEEHFCLSYLERKQLKKYFKNKYKFLV